MHIQLCLVALFLSYVCIVEAAGVRGNEDEHNLRKLKSQKSPKSPKSPKAHKKKKKKDKKKKGCENDPTWIIQTGQYSVSCSDLEDLLVLPGFTKEIICSQYGPTVVGGDKSINDACCICGGSIHVSRYPSLTPSSSPSQSPTV